MTDRLRELTIPGVWLAELLRHEDVRGWLVELFREDSLARAGLRDAMPTMAYLSSTRPGVARGPHEHMRQTDTFVFLGTSDFSVQLWDNRPGSPAPYRSLRLTVGPPDPVLLVVPPRVVHAYSNTGDQDGWVLNIPNRLYRGWNRVEEADEVRHEDDPQSAFRLGDRT